MLAYGLNEWQQAAQLILLAEQFHICDLIFQLAFTNLFYHNYLIEKVGILNHTKISYLRI